MEEKDLLTRSEMNKLFLEYKNGNMLAREELIMRNIRLVYKIANRYRDYSYVDFEDLVEEGKIGLMKAIERFDCQRDNTFATYAVFWIRQEMIRFIEKESMCFHVSTEVYYLNKKINKLRNELQCKLNREVEDKEIAEILGVSIEKFNEIKINNGTSISLNTLIFDDSMTLEDSIEDKSVDVFEEVFKKLKKEDILNILKKADLSERELEIIYLRYGFYGKPKSLVETAKIVGISRSRVNQIEFRVLKKLRQSEVARLLVYYFDSNDSYILKYADIASKKKISFQTIRNYFMNFSSSEMEFILKELDQTDLKFLSTIYSKEYKSIISDEDIVDGFNLLVEKIEKIISKCKRKI